MSVDSEHLCTIAYAVGLVSILFQKIQSFGINLQRCNSILAQRFDMIQGLGESRSEDE